jgi:methionyl-tRNA synthetase
MDPIHPTSGIIARFQQEAPSDGPYGELKAEIEASLAEAKKHVEEEQFSQALRTILEVGFVACVAESI